MRIISPKVSARAHAVLAKIGATSHPVTALLVLGIFFIALVYPTKAGITHLEQRNDIHASGVVTDVQVSHTRNYSSASHTYQDETDTAITLRLDNGSTVTIHEPDEPTVGDGQTVDVLVDNHDPSKASFPGDSPQLANYLSALWVAGALVSLLAAFVAFNKRRSLAT